MPSQPETTAVAFSAPSPGKQPLSQKQLHTLFGSADAKESWRSCDQHTDLSLLYASMESLGSVGSMRFWRSNDMPALASVDSAQMPPLMKASGPGPDLFASMDVTSLFASIEPLSLKSVEALGLPSLEGKPASPNSVTSKWRDAYLSALEPPAIQSASEPPAIQSTSYVEVERTPKENKAKKNSTPAGRGRPKPGQLIYVEPLETDVISGRGGKSNAWPGNLRYREVIEETKPAYHAGQKFEKTIKSQEVVDILLNEGRRFLKLETSGPRKGEYYLMTKNQARKKAAQALREENTAESRRLKREKYAKK